MKLSLTAPYWRAKWCSILLVFFATFISAQTTLVNYQFSGNLNPDAGALGSPVLEYKNTAGINTTPTFPSNRLQALASGHYLELSINATGASNLALSFNAYFISSVVGYGSWQVYANTGAGNTFASIGSIDLLSGASLENNGLFSEGLPVAASGKSDLKVRIISDYDGFGTNYLRIDNLKLVHGTPKCGVFTDTDVAIATGSDAAEATNTVFASTQTNTVGELKNYRIRNWYGTAGTQLTIDSIAILPSSGTTKYDFVIESSNNLTNIEDADYIRYCSGGIGSNCFWGTWIYSEYGTFGIRFSPKAEGVRKALVRIYSNGVPSPYEFYVIGGGRSCSSTSKDYVTNTTVLNLSNPTLYSNLSVNDLIGGTTNAPNPAVFTKLYPQGSSPYNPLYTSSTSSWYAKETAKTITYGGDDGIDISNLRNVTVEFNVAVFGSVNTSDTTLDGYGVTNNDFVILDIEDGTDNWVNVMRLNGSNNSSNKRRYVFNSTGMQLTKTYERPATLTTGSNSGNTTTINAYARFQLTLPLSISSELTNFRFRITAKGNTGAVWLIDDVRIKSDAADYTIYNGSTWSNGELGETKKVIFDAPYTFTNANTTICACEITENGSVTLNSGINLTVKGLINNKADANHFLIADGANLIQQEDGAINTGSAKVEKYVADVQNSLQTGQHMDYIYWSAPVAGQNLQSFSPNTPRNRFYQYHEPTDYFHVAPENEFITAKGYAIRAESGLPYGYNKTYAFSGVPNNGYISIGIQRSPDQGLVQHGYNLIGNPYPSNINFDSFYALNSSKIWKTAWFWVNDSNVYYQTGSGYEGNGYSVYNGTGGNDGVTDNNPHNAITTSQFIKSGQGFIVQKKTNGNATLNYENSIRVSNVAPFYHKTENPKDRFWLKLISPQNTINTALIGYIEGATNGFEQDFDAETFGLSSDLLFSKMEDYRLLIQGRNAIFTNEDRVKLGANFFQTGQYQLALMKAEGIFENSQHIYLKDHLLNTVTDLSAEPYIFDATAGLNEGRFEIVYRPEALLASQEMAKPEILIYRDGENFVAKTSGEIISLLEVYDVAGRMIYRSSPARSEATISGSRLSQGIYFVRIVLENGQVVSKKIRK